LPEFLKLFAVTREQALNEGRYDSDTRSLPAPRKKYELGKSPAGLMAAKMKIEEPKKLGPILTINDEDHERRLREDETYCQIMGIPFEAT